MAVDPTQTPSPPEPDERSVSELVFDVSERASSLVREEIELAKAEIGEKVGKILRGSVVGVAAGTFAFLALILVMEGIAWLLNEEVFDGKTWPGFFVEAALFLIVAAGNDPYVNSSLGVLPQTTIVPSLLFGDIGVKRADEEQQKLPYYPPPPPAK